MQGRQGDKNINKVPPPQLQSDPWCRSFTQAMRVRIPMGTSVLLSTHHTPGKLKINATLVVTGGSLDFAGFFIVIILSFTLGRNHAGQALRLCSDEKLYPSPKISDGEI
jgi:hypothetical protein